MGPQGIRYYDRYNATRGKGIKGTHKGIGWCCVVRRRLRVDGRCTTQRTRELQGHSTPQQPGQSTPPQTAQHTACGLESTCSHHGCTCRSIRNDLDINVVTGASHDVKVFKVVDINAESVRAVKNAALALFQPTTCADHPEKTAKSAPAVCRQEPGSSSPDHNRQFGRRDRCTS